MNRKSLPIAWGLIMIFLLTGAFFISAGNSLAQPDLCSDHARQYADRYANPGDNSPGAFSGGIVCAPDGGTASNSNWSLLYDHAYDRCAREAVIH